MVITNVFHAEGGIAAVNRLVILALSDAGYQLDIFSLHEKNNEIDIRYINPSNAKFKVFHGKKIFFITEVFRTVLQNEYDIVYSDHVNVAASIALPSKLKLCRYFVWLHGIEVFPPNPDYTGRIGIKSAWKGLASSAYTKQRVIEQFPKLPVTACELALDPIRYSVESMDENIQIQPELTLSSVDGSIQKIDQQMLLNVGRMESEPRNKGQDLILHAFQPVNKLFKNAQLVLVGNGSDYSRLLSLAKSFPLDIQKRIFMPGQVGVDLLDELYKKCYLFSMPSAGEGFGLVYLEAMSRAKPCLGANVDATPYLIKDGTTGLLVNDPKSSDQIAEKMIWLLKNPVCAKEMGIKGYKLLRSNFLFPHFKERFLREITQ